MTSPAVSDTEMSTAVSHCLHASQVQHTVYFPTQVKGPFKIPNNHLASKEFAHYVLCLALMVLQSRLNSQA